MVVKTELEKLGLQPLSVNLGEIELAEKPTSGQMSALKDNLSALGFELIDDKKGRTIEKIKKSRYRTHPSRRRANQTQIQRIPFPET